jgi:hypothetical protein
MFTYKREIIIERRSHYHSSLDLEEMLTKEMSKEMSKELNKKIFEEMYKQFIINVENK